jgi:predicted N-acetyltransferase YhbS
MDLIIRPARADEPDDVLRLTQAAFAGQGSLDPPSSVFQETADTVRQAMTEGVVLVAEHEGRLVGVVRLRAIDDPPALYCGRLAVSGDVQGRGIGSALIAEAERRARAEGYAAVAVGVRLALPRNLRFFQNRGYRVVAEHSHPGYDQPTFVRLLKHVAADGLDGADAKPSD